jgi:hypothetical protein
MDEQAAFEEEDREIRRAAYSLGYDQGRAAGSWVTDGNTSDATYRALLQGLEDGDPEIITGLPTSPLSGEWADSYSLADLSDDLNVDQESDDFDDLCWEFEAGFDAGVQDEITTTARYHLGEES